MCLVLKAFEEYLRFSRRFATGDTRTSLPDHTTARHSERRDAMAPHSDKRIQQASVAGGRKRGAPGAESRDSPPRKTSRSEHVDEADPGRLKVSSSSSSSKPLKEGRNGTPLREGQKVGAKGAGPTITKLGKGKGKVKVQQGKGTIDDIFSGVKRLKEEKKEEEVQRVAKKKKMKEEHKRRQANPFTGEGGPEKRWGWADEVKPVRFDDEGLPIYTWDSLRIGQGGGTELCPFDCDCCF